MGNRVVSVVESRRKAMDTPKRVRQDTRSMKKLILLLGVAVAVSAQNPRVSNIAVTDLSHSTMLLHFDVSAPWNNVHIRYIPTAEGTCDSGKGGLVQPSTYPGDTGGNFRPQKGFKIILGGLQPGTE